MSIKFNGAQISLSIANYQPTDFSKVTAHPEFVLKGKKFFDETGQLKEGTAALSGTGVDTSDATATEDDVMEGATFYAGGEKKTGTHKCEAVPDHTDTDFALHFSGREGAINVTYSSTEKAAFAAAPEGKEIDSFVDTNFLAENIKKDKSIFGVVGTYEGEGGADSALPIEVATEAEMTALLTSGEVGGVYKYTGTTGTYENGALYVLEEETVNITLKADNGGGNTMCSTYVKFGEAPSSDFDSEYFCTGGNLDIKQGNESSYDSYVSLGTDSINIAVNPVAYIWVPQTDNLAGYKLNGGSLINVGTGYANATEVQLSEGDVLTILSTWLD